jgi:DNA-binding transcriptional MerR regulator
MSTTIMNGLMVQWGQRLETLSTDEVAARCGLHPTLVERLVALGLIEPLDGRTDRFPPDVTLRLQRALRLRRDLGLSYNGAALVLELLDRIEDLERRLEQYERQSNRWKYTTP